MLGSKDGIHNAMSEWVSGATFTTATGADRSQAGSAWSVTRAVCQSPLHEHTQAGNTHQGSVPHIMSAVIYVSCLPQSPGDYRPAQHPGLAYP